jgi:hypothetical protein
MSRREKFTPEQVAEALRKHRGLYDQAAKHLSAATGRACSTRTIIGYVARHAALRTLLNEIAEANLDQAEEKILEAIEKNDVGASMFYLRAKGRGRGYARTLNPAPSADRVEGEAAKLSVPDKIEDPVEWAKAHGGKGKRS